MYFLIGSALLLTFLLTINLVSTAASMCLWNFAKRFVESWSPRRKASSIFALRILPVVLAALIIFGFVLPSFLLYEPPNSGETVGLKLAVIISVAIFGIAAAAFRVFGSWWRTRRLIGDWTKNSERIDSPSSQIPAFKLRHSFPVFAIVGIFRPRLFIAEQLLEELEPNELAAVIEHELGHISARDNLKRLLMRVCGDILIVPLGDSLDEYWTDVTELAADEFAVNRGGRQLALDLASALIKIARILPAEPLPAMAATSFIVEKTGESLTARVRRLLSMAETERQSEAGNKSVVLAAFSFVALFLVVTLATDATFLLHIHSISETVLSVLQ